MEDNKQKQADSSMWVQRIREADATRSASPLESLLKFFAIGKQMASSLMPLAMIMDTFRSALPSNHTFIAFMSEVPQFKYKMMAATALAHVVAHRIDAACEIYLQGAELGMQIASARTNRTLHKKCALLYASDMQSTD